MLKPSFPERTNLYLTNLENKSKIEVLIPDGILKCENHEDFYLNVVQYNTFHSFYHVIESYNNNFNIIIDNTIVINCSLPTGNITAHTIRDYINNHNILKTHIKVIYDNLKNTFEFQILNSNESIQLEIINCHTLLGFHKSENILSLPCISSKPINVMAITNIFLHLETGYDLNLNDSNLDNHTSEIVKSNSIILSLPINQSYNNMITYTNDNGFFYRCNKQETITSLCISIRDQYGKLIPDFPSSHLVLQFSKRLNNDKYGDFLEKITDYINKILLIISTYFLGL